MTIKVWICAVYETLIPTKGDDGNDDCPFADYQAHRHLAEFAMLDHCGWYEVAALREEE